MKYTHPIKYKGILDCKYFQHLIKQFVEINCLGCTEFYGKEHDFSDCNHKFGVYKVCNKNFETKPYRDHVLTCETEEGEE